MDNSKEICLNDSQVKFCHEYVLDSNATRAYKEAYPNCKTGNSASVSAHNLLRNTKVQSLIKELQTDVERALGLTKIMLLMEHKKIAFSTFDNIQKTWLDQKEFNELSDEQKACISEIEMRVKPTKEGITKQFKIKFFDKLKSLDAINKMLGYYEPENKGVTMQTKGTPHIHVMDEKTANLYNELLERFI